MGKLDKIIELQSEQIKELTDSERVHMKDIVNLGVENDALLQVIKKQGVKLLNQEYVNSQLQEQIEGYKKILADNGFSTDVDS